MRVFHWINRYALVYGLLSAILAGTAFSVAGWQVNRNIVNGRNLFMAQELIHLTARLEQETINSRAMGAAILFGRTNSPAKLSVLGKIPAGSTQLLPPLDELRSISQNDLAFLTNTRGIVTASAGSAQLPQSGLDLSLHPYLRFVAQGIPGVYPAVTSNDKRGIFLFAPVHAGTSSTGNPIGAVVVLVNAEKFDAWLKDWSGGPAILVSPQGVVFSTNKPEWLLHTYGAESQERISQIRDSRQFGTSFDHIAPVPLPIDPDARIAELSGDQYVLQTHALDWNDSSGEWRLLLLDKRQPWWVQWQILAISFLAGFITLFLLFWLRAIARNSILQHAIQRDLAIAAATFESREGILITDAQTNIIKVNHAFTGITGYESNEVIGKKPSILSSGRQDTAFYKRMWDEIAIQGGWSGEMWNRRKNGEVYPEHLTITPIYGSEGEVVNYVGIFSDITQRKATEQEILKLAFYDVLTGLPNRRLLNERLEHAMACGKREGCHGALMFMDIDKFKQLNDTHGHGMGDLLLAEVARRILNCMREADTVARFGGDEFVVLLGNLDTDEDKARTQATIVAEKIRTVLSEPYVLTLTHENSPPVTVTHHASSSIGVVLFRGHSASAEEILKWADIAMYHAKAEGRNAVHFHGE